MKKKISFLLFTSIICFLFTTLPAQEMQDTAYINKLIKESKSHIGDDTARAIRMAKDAIRFSQNINFKEGEAYALKNIGLVYYTQGKYVETLDYWNQSLHIFEAIKDDIGTSNLLNNIGAIYFDQGVDDKALDYCLQSLKIAEKTKDKLRILSALTTIGAIYYNKKDPVAIKYLLQALPLCLETDNKPSYVVIAGNLGEIYADADSTAKALEYFQKAINTESSGTNIAFAYNGIGKLYLKNNKNDLAIKNHLKALAISQKADDKLQIIRSYHGTADVYASQKNYQQALNDYNKAILLGEEMHANVELKDLYQKTALAYSNLNDYQNAFEYQTRYANIRDTLYNEMAAQKLGKLQFDFDMFKKEGEINLLTKEKSLKEAEVKVARQTRTGLLIVMVLILIIAFIIYRGYLTKARTNEILDKQKDEIEGLLLNILPEEIADELKATGVSKPRHFDEASVLFTDFKGFTAIADKLSPTDLVEELNTCFMEFDNIIERYDLEKIKTIGDAYMCAGNIPSADPDHAYKIVKAAMDIQKFIFSLNEKRRASGLESWNVRIGLHIGPLVAGVVGRKKYAYDIWGGTVNIASRMESNGSIEKINISSSMYDAIKDYFECSYRGKVNAKNIGDIDMYFIEHEKTEVAYQQKKATAQLQMN